MVVAVVVLAVAVVVEVGGGVEEGKLLRGEGVISDSAQGDILASERSRRLLPVYRESP